MKDVIESFRERLLDMVTSPETGKLFPDRESLMTEGKVPRLPLFLGAFHASCDDHRVPRDARQPMLDELFEVQS